MPRAECLPAYPPISCDPTETKELAISRIATDTFVAAHAWSYFEMTFGPLEIGMDPLRNIVSLVSLSIGTVL